MKRADLLLRISEILGEIVEDENLRLAETTTAPDVLDWDSANHVRLVVAIEAEFGIRFEASEIAAPEDVGQLLDLIESKLKAKAKA